MDRRPHTTCTPSVFLVVILVTLVVTSAATHAAWPNLDVLQNYPKPGVSCSLRGAAPPGSEKAKSNGLKNRYKLPTTGFDPVLLSDIIGLPSGTPAAPPSSADPNNQRAVTVVGFVREVKPGGTMGESCNCGAKGKNQVDTHLELVLDPNNQDPSGKGMVVVEVQERIRRLAAKGLLASNIGNKWSTSMLRARLLGRWVKLSGWLFYDPDHHLQCWQVDKQNTMDGKNWRETGWEIHPVMAIESGVAPPPDTPGVAALDHHPCGTRPTGPDPALAG